MAQVPNIPNINQYHQHFKQTAPYIKNEPRTDRGCNDKCCYVLFIIFTLFLIGAGAFFLAKADFASLGARFSNSTSTNTKTLQTTKQIDAYDISNLKPGIPVIIGMIVFSLVLAIAFLCLMIRFPTCMFYTMLGLGAILILALTILLFVGGQIVGGVIFLVVFLVYLLAIFCAREKIRVGVVLLETASRFLAEKPTVFLAPFALFFAVILFQFFWIASLIAITVYTGNAKTQQEIDNQQKINGIFIGIWGFLQIFYSFFFHYCLVFIIATAAAMWYYNVDGNYLCTSLRRIVSNHIGSFTFAAMIMAIVTLARQSAQRQQSESSAGAAICYCLIACCLKAIEDLLQVLNNNAIIVMAVTGESYIDSAKSAISLIFDNFLLFYLIDMVSSMVKLAGIIFICAVPGLTGFLLLRATSEDPDDVNFLTFGTVIIVLIAMLIGAIFLSVFSQALSCVFIFYCLDKKFISLNYPAPKNTPPSMRKLFEEMNGSHDVYQPSHNPAGYALPPPSFNSPAVNNQPNYNNAPNPYNNPQGGYNPAYSSGNSNPSGYRQSNPSQPYYNNPNPNPNLNPNMNPYPRISNNSRTSNNMY